MAEYYPLLARAVASLTESTPETRRAIYERARTALLKQLQSADPPVPPEDIERERVALDEAMARVEADYDVVKKTPPPPPPPGIRVPPPRPVAPGPSGGEGSWPPPPKLVLPSAPEPPGETFSQKSAPSLRSNESGFAKEPGFGPIEVSLPRHGGVSPEPASAPDEAADAESQQLSLWKRLSRSRAEPESEATNARAAIVPSGRSGFGEAMRSPANTAGPATINRNAVVALGVVLLAVVAVVGTLAWRLRDNPAEIARGKQAAPAETTDSSAGPKIAERIGGAARAPSTTAPAPQSGPAASGGAPAIVAGHRAALLVDAPDEPAKIKTYFGSVNWTLETLPTDPLPVLRADVDLPDAKLKATISISRRPDPKSPASHVIAVRFTPEPGSDITGVAEVDTLSMRVEDQRVGDPLQGGPVPVTANYFIIGLIHDDVMTARNMDLLKTRAWVDLPMKLNSGKIAKLTFEKGPEGDRLLAQALAAWN